MSAALSPDSGPWTYAELADLRSRSRAMGRDFDLIRLSHQLARDRVAVDRALWALTGRSIVDAWMMLEGRR